MSGFEKSWLQDVSRRGKTAQMCIEVEKDCAFLSLIGAENKLEVEKKTYGGRKPDGPIARSDPQKMNFQKTNVKNLCDGPCKPGGLTARFAKNFVFKPPKALSSLLGSPFFKPLRASVWLSSFLYVSLVVSMRCRRTCTSATSKKNLEVILPLSLLCCLFSCVCLCKAGSCIRGRFGEGGFEAFEAFEDGGGRGGGAEGRKASKASKGENEGFEGGDEGFEGFEG